MPSEKLTFSSPRHLSQLYATNEANLLWAEQQLGVTLASRENWVEISAEDPRAVQTAVTFFTLLDTARTQGIKIGKSDFKMILETLLRGEESVLRELFEQPLVLKLKKTSVVPKTINQKRYLQFIREKDIVFGIGPAGTGKTYLAMAAALHALQEGEVDKIIITRPAVEAGEALGFLPGELEEKLDPYLRPIYDALYDMVGREESLKMREKGILEIAPLAYMRGRTLSNAYVVLDEAQNTTPEQMMMFLTRLGENSRMIVTGDITQVDLPRSKRSGLKQAIEILKPIDGIRLFYFDHTDVVRHHLVSQIIRAYEKYQREQDRQG